MKILIVSTLKRKVTASETASRSRIIFELAQGMAKRGHQVSLMGTGDSSVPGVTTIPIIPSGWVDLPPVENPFFREVATMIQLAKRVIAVQGDFDVIHNHLYPEFFTPMIEAELTTPMLTTIHVQAADYIDEVLATYARSSFVSISQAHRSSFAKARIDRVIYNGIDTELYTPGPQKEDYLLWIGRLSKARAADGSFMDPKGVRWAIKLAQQTSSRLLMAGNVEDKAFFETDVKAHINNQIRWVGPVSAEQPLAKDQIADLMRKAKVFLMPINWEEPFGLVMAEAMASGTPVIGFDRGAVSELVADGVTGFVVPPSEGVGGLAKALERIDTIDPKACRERVIASFSTDRMIAEYEHAYQSLIEDGRNKSPAQPRDLHRS